MKTEIKNLYKMLKCVKRAWGGSHYMKIWWLILIIFVGECILSSGLSISSASEGEMKEDEVHGVMVVSLNAPLWAALGKTVDIEVVIGNETTAEVTATLTVSCPTTKQQIGSETKRLDGLSSCKLVYRWDTAGLNEGDYVIRAELKPLPGETDTADNVEQAEVYLRR